MTDWIQTALELGFTAAAPLDPAKLEALPSVRDMCAADKCRSYSKNWTCPPACGTLEDCSAQMHRFRNGILLQSVGRMTDSLDFEAYERTGKEHITRFYRFAALFREAHPDALCLGAGGCRICAQCAYPEPCRFPEKACSSMEGYGLFVTQVCKDCDLPYYYGKNTIAYTACVLF